MSVLKRRVCLSLVCSLLLIGLLLVGCEALPRTVTTSDAVWDESLRIEPESTSEPVSQNTVRLVAVGDNLIHEPIYRMAERSQGYDFLPSYQPVADLIATADLAFLQQEVLVSGEAYLISAWPSFNSPKELARDMANLGFDLVNLANNHIMDKDIWCLEESLRVWEDLDIPYIGVYDSRKESGALRFLSVNDCRLAFIGYCYGLNSWEFEDSWHFKIGNLQDRQRMTADIQQAKQEADIVIVSMHWGEEYHLQPSTAQQELAAWLASQNVDLVIGHHPHVIQPVEQLVKADGNLMPVVYSLGNFISAQQNSESLLGTMLSVEIYQENGGKWRVGCPRMIPLISHYEDVDGFEPYVAVYPMSTYTEELASRHQLRVSEPNVNLNWFQQLYESVVEISYR